MTRKLLASFMDTVYNIIHLHTLIHRAAIQNHLQVAVNN